MQNIFKKVAALLCAGVMFTTPVLADGINASFDKGTRDLAVEGELGRENSNARVFSIITKSSTLPSYTTEDYVNGVEGTLNDVLDMSQILSDSNGDYDLGVISNPIAGLLHIWVAADSMTNPVHNTVFVPTSDAVNSFIDTIARASSYTVVDSALRAESVAMSTYADTAFGADMRWYNQLDDKSVVAQKIYANRSNYTGNNAVYIIDDDIFIYSILAYISEQDNADEVRKLVKIEDSDYTTLDKEKIIRLLDLDTFYSNTVFSYLRSASEEDLNGVLDKAKTMDMSTPSKLMDAITISTINYKFSKVSGWRGAYDILIEHVDDLDGLTRTKLTSNASNDAMFTDILKKSYSSVYELCNAINTWKRPVIDGGNNGGGGSNSVISYPIIDTKPITPVVKETFSDMGNHGWAKTAVNNLYKKGIIDGVGDGQFAPDAYVTREQFVKMIVGALNITAQSEDVNFSDVDKNEWYYSYINTATAAGIVEGDGSTFGVGRSITRQDMAVIVCRAISAMKLAEINADIENTFADAGSMSDYAVGMVAALAELGIVSGRDNNMFAPLENMTRAEAAVIINNVINKFSL